MSEYDLKSLNLPKLYGGMLKTFAGAAGNPVTQPLLLGSLLENGGIPKIRSIKFSEEPTYFPLVIPSEHAEGHLPLPEDLPLGTYYIEVREASTPVAKALSAYEILLDVEQAEGVQALGDLDAVRSELGLADRQRRLEHSGSGRE